MCRVPTNRRATIMPKKYLIYIHNDERFDTLNERGQKSNLVNELLDKHWATEAGVQTNYQKGLGVQTLHPPRKKQPKIIAKPDQIKPALKTVGAEVDTCPHGYAKGMCKKVACNKKFAAVESA